MQHIVDNPLLLNFTKAYVCCKDKKDIICNAFQDGEGDAGELRSLFDVARVWEERIKRFLERQPESEIMRDVQRQTRAFRFEELAMSFNGGKDCLVIDAKKSPAAIPCVYVMSTNPFPEVDNFVSNCVHTYHLTVHRYPIPMKTAFATYLSAHPKVQAIFVGTRRTDPHGEFLGHFNPTDRGWPPFVRCQPVIDWHYREIWGFLRELEVPYCSLYDLGYTSLGGTTDTQPNPKLLMDEDGIGGQEVTFRPAYELTEDSEERLGRD
ncbi:hypothetical protein BGX38DRAFT_1250079 [Terfezia claveryi]|nr:hypothetical protein BGX38DRAFT_1250079 [Terfezia claveryi]